MVVLSTISLVPRLVGRGVWPAPGTATLKPTYLISPCNRDVCMNYIIYFAHILRWVHKVAKGNCCVGGGGGGGGEGGGGGGGGGGGHAKLY